MTTEGKGMDVQPMDLEEAETLARAGVAGRVSTALFRELERMRAELTQARAYIDEREQAMRGVEQDAEQHAYEAWTAGQGGW